MTDFFKSYSFKFWLFAFAVFLTRLPFLSHGYGLDENSWSMAATARHIAATGQIEASRFPGFPVIEFVCSLFYNGYPFRLNLLTAIISTVGFLFFALTLRVWKFRQIFLAATALVFVRTVYINSTTTIDYLWALTFLLISLYFIARHKPIAAGIFLGIAMGCRITSGAMIIPYAIMILQTDGLNKNAVRVFKLSFATVIIAGLLYLPLYIKYGAQLFSYNDVVYPAVIKVLYRFFTDVWGIIGLAGLVSAILFLILAPVKTGRYLFPRSINEKYVFAWLIAIDVYIIIFLRFPVDPGYLIPMVPFLILLFGKYLNEKAFRVFAVSLIVSPFLLSISPLDRNDAATPSSASFTFKMGGENYIADLRGAVFTYQSRKINGELFADKVLRSLDTLKSKTLLVAGTWYAQVNLKREEAMLPFKERHILQKEKTGVELREFINQDSLLYYIGKGYNVYYLPHQDMNNLLARNVDITLYGAEPYFKNSEQ